jgi:hypothetical protein
MLTRTTQLAVRTSQTLQFLQQMDDLRETTSIAV